VKKKKRIFILEKKKRIYMKRIERK